MLKVLSFIKFYYRGKPSPPSAINSLVAAVYIVSKLRGFSFIVTLIILF